MNDGTSTSSSNGSEYRFLAVDPFGMVTDVADVAAVDTAAGAANGDDGCSTPLGGRNDGVGSRRGESGIRRGGEGTGAAGGSVPVW
jgi:hypothetical protein